MYILQVAGSHAWSRAEPPHFVIDIFLSSHRSVPNAAGDHRAAATELPLAWRARGGALVSPTRTYNGTALGSFFDYPHLAPRPLAPPKASNPTYLRGGYVSMGGHSGRIFRCVSLPAPDGGASRRRATVILGIRWFLI